MTCKLIIDDHEKYVLRHEYELENVNFEKKRIEVGDYAIVGPAGNILVIIERKSYDDFSASISDGRHQNKEKLIDLRAKTGCRIIYLIEGKEFPRPDEKFGGKPYSNIESSIFHLMMRDNIMIWRTKDTVDTAKFLGRFVKSMNSLIKKNDMPTLIEEPTIGFMSGSDTPSDQSNLLTARHATSDHDVVKTIWSQFTGISLDSASDFIRQCCLADLICGKVSPAQIATFKIGNNRTINKTLATHLAQIPAQTQIKLLAAVPGISKVTATVIIDQFPLRNLLLMEDISEIIVGKNNRKLGRALSAKVIKYFNYKYTPPAEPIVITGPVAAGPDIDLESLIDEIENT